MINLSAEEKLAALDSIHGSVAEVSEAKTQPISPSVKLVVQALKKIESDIKARQDKASEAIEKRAQEIVAGKAGRDGIDGKDGRSGIDGKDGRKGIDGKDGADGDDGVSVVDANIDFDGSLIISLSSGRVINVGEVVAPDLAEKINVITNGGGTSQQVLDTLTSLQTQITNITSSKSANFFFAAPNGSAGAPTFRAIVAADVPALNQNTTGSAATLTTGRTIAVTGDLTYTSPTFNGSGNITAVGTLATVNSNVGTFANATVTVNAKGQVTAAVAGATNAYMTGYNLSTYTSNVAVGDHIKFDTVHTSSGSNITLDVATAYTTTLNVASVGRITLKAGKTYSLWGSINNAVSLNYGGHRWVNSDTGMTISLASGGAAPNSSLNRHPGVGAFCFFTPSVDTRVELQIASFSALTSVNGTLDAIGPAQFHIQTL